MVVLQIEHYVTNYEGWKKAFDSDPIDRKKSGVKYYRIYQPFGDPNYVIIDLEFEDINHAQSTLNALKNLWGKVEGSVMQNPKARIIVITEIRKYE